MHFKHIERLTAEEIVKQRDVIIKEKAEEMGIAADDLIKKMYRNTARKEAMR
jgi:hypothetical protein